MKVFSLALAASIMFSALSGTALAVTLTNQQQGQLVTDENNIINMLNTFEQLRNLVANNSLTAAEQTAVLSAMKNDITSAYDSATGELVIFQSPGVADSDPALATFQEDIIDELGPNAGLLDIMNGAPVYGLINASYTLSSLGDLADNSLAISNVFMPTELALLRFEDAKLTAETNSIPNTLPALTVSQMNILENTLLSEQENVTNILAGKKLPAAVNCTASPSCIY
jgi:hypothetical protein